MKACAIAIAGALALLTGTSAMAQQSAREQKDRVEADTNKDGEDRASRAQRREQARSPYSNEAQARLRRAREIARELRKDDEPDHYVFEAFPRPK